MMELTITALSHAGEGIGCHARRADTAPIVLDAVAAYSISAARIVYLWCEAATRAPVKN